MSETNGESDKSVSAVRKVLAQRRMVYSTLLQDIDGDFPSLRQFLIGSEGGSEVWPPGTMTVRTEPHAVIVALQLRLFEVEATYRSESWHGVWEMIENDLSSQSTPWQLNYQGRQREEKRVRSALDGSS